MNKVDVQLDYNFSRPIDVQKNMNCFKDDDDILNSSTNILLDKHSRALITDLYSCWKESEDQFLTISMSKRGYKAKSRYNPNTISSYMINAIKLLKQKKLIDVYPGFYDAKRRISRLTRIKPSQLIINRFKQYDFSPHQLLNSTKRECLYLIDKNSKLIEYEDNFETHEIREVLRNYNLILAKTFFDIPCLSSHYVKRGDGMKIIISDFCKIDNRRFENNWKNGGNFFGSWWHKLDIKSVNELSNHMIINDSETSYIDFSNIFFEILFNKFEINMTGFDQRVLKKYFRFIKNDNQLNFIISKSINSKNFSGLFKSISNERKRLGILEPVSKKEIQKLVDYICKNYNQIYGLFFSNKKFDWDSIISEIFYNLLKDFGNASINIPLIKVRDKFFFPTNIESNVLEYVKKSINKTMSLNQINIRTIKCCSYSKKSERSIFQSLNSNKLVYTKRFKDNKKVFINFMKKKNVWNNHLMNIGR